MKWQRKQTSFEMSLVNNWEGKVLDVEWQLIPGVRLLLRKAQSPRVDRRVRTHSHCARRRAVHDAPIELVQFDRCRASFSTLESALLRATTLYHQPIAWVPSISYTFYTCKLQSTFIIIFTVFTIIHYNFHSIHVTLTEQIRQKHYRQF